MTVFEFAVFRFAAQRMFPHEMEIAKILAERGDRGDLNARRDLRELSLKIIRETDRDGGRAESK